MQAPIPSAKAELRRRLRAQRRALSTRQRRQAARRLLRQFLRWREFRRARHVALYLSMASELDTSLLRHALARRGLRLYAPRIHRRLGLRFVPLRPSRLPRHAQGMRQPPPGPARSLRQLDLLLLPLLGFDDQGQRLGQGGGYYDRALAGLKRARRPRRIGLAYACQQVERLPVEPHDRPLHAVLTERGLRRFPHRLPP
ncbi:MAG: 5-formyltetrahydrofolate cyclo-ligase [Stagnimonas sp.]|nr:5-formyltetrahydrofolate cyclo-ligase [Stagnimonas sp.]